MCYLSLLVVVSILFPLPPLQMALSNESSPIEQVQLPKELFMSIYEWVSEVLRTANNADELKCADDQIRVLLSRSSSSPNGWCPYLDRFASTLDAYKTTAAEKQADKARQCKQFADMYGSMVEEAEFGDKLFVNLNKVSLD